VAVTYQRDVIRVTAECPDVLLDPVQRGHLVEQRIVARRVAVSRTQETCRRQRQLSAHHSFIHHQLYAVRSDNSDRKGPLRSTNKLHRLTERNSRLAHYFALFWGLELRLGYLVQNQTSYSCSPTPNL